MIVLVSNQTSKSNFGPFLDRDEAWIVYLPLVFVPVCLLEFVLQKTALGMSDARQWIFHLAINFIVLGWGHAALTFMMLAGLPELRQVIAVKTGGRPHRFWLGLFVLFVAIATLVYRGGAFIGLQLSSEVESFWILTGVFLIANHVHAINQIRGVSVAYNVNTRRLLPHDGEELARSLRADRFERWAFRFVVSSLILREAFLMATGAGWFDLSDSALRDLLMYVFNGLLLAGGLWVVVQSLRHPHVWKTKKPVYSLRPLFYLAAPFSFFSRLATVTIHTSDYFGIFGRATSRSSMEKSRRRKFLAFAVAFALGWTILATIKVDYVKTAEGALRIPTWVHLLLASAYAMDLLHILLDRFIFKMRDPVTRENVGRLIA